jgi:hypothetical protein
MRRKLWILSMSLIAIGLGYSTPADAAEVNSDDTCEPVVCRDITRDCDISCTVCAFPTPTSFERQCDS